MADNTQEKKTQDKKAKDDYQELTNYMLANNLTAEEVLACIKE